MEKDAPPKPSWFKRFKSMLLPMAAGALIAGVSVLVGMRLYFAPRAQKAYLRVETGLDIMVLADLQKRYHARHGAYARDFEALAGSSDDPEGLRKGLAEHLDLETLLISGTSRQFVIEANVLDPERTLMRFEGPR
ncbi:MAG: hypothetical protein PHF00_01755 [Elusimicrobia bacterium]|nr:hypothetical protein [Elusimicrobiota bacterium]